MKTKNLFLFAAAISMLVACSHAPDGNSKEVKALAIVSSIEFMDSHFDNVIKSSIVASLRGDESKVKDIKYMIDNNSFGFLQRSEYDILLGDNYDITNFNNILDSCISKRIINLTDIRIDKKDDNLRKSEYSAKLLYGLLYYDISYTAQYTEDGKLIVEAIVK